MNLAVMHRMIGKRPKTRSDPALPGPHSSLQISNLQQHGIGDKFNLREFSSAALPLRAF